MKRSFLLRSILGAALFGLGMTDDSPSAAGALEPTDATAGAESAPGEASGGASDAGATDASGSPASAEGAPGSTGTAAGGDAPLGESNAAPAAAGSTPASATGSADASPSPTSNGVPPAAAADPTPGVSIDVEDHAEARERFAGLMATLHGFENQTVEQLRTELRAIAELLHLHSIASSTAEATGSYSPADL